MLPMITLGIPGSPTAAVMLGGLIIWGLQPGPMLFKEKPDFVWGLIASMYTGNVIGVLMVLVFVPLFAAILRVPFAILTPLIVVVCAIGAYAVHNSMIDIWYMLIFGVVGYVFKKLDYPLAPLRAGPGARRHGRERAAPEPDHVPGIAGHLRDATDRGGHHGRRHLLLRPAGDHPVVAAHARAPPRDRSSRLPAYDAAVRSRGVPGRSRVLGPVAEHRHSRPDARG